MTTTINASNSGSGGLIQTADASGVLALQTAGTTAVTVDTSQRVGIGTTSPAANLEVKGSSGQNIYVSYTSGSQLRLKSDSGDSGVGTTGSTPLLFLISNGEVGRFDTSGNLGIGTSSPTSGYKLNVGSTSSVTTLNGAAITLFASGSLTSNIGGVLNFRPQLGTTASDIFNLSICAYDHSGDGNADGLSINGSDGISFCTSGNSRNERMRLTTGGVLLLNTTANALSNGNNQLIDGPGGVTYIQHVNGTASGSSYVGFIYNGSFIGNIAQNGTTGVLYNLTSDYRLKDNPTPLTGAKDFVMALQPKTWDWWDGSGKGVGFIAHEFMEVAKYSGHGEKDEVDSENKPVYQSIQPSSSEVMANLVAFVQEQQALITSLTARIAALEGTPA
jgi:hypothetical protein